MTDAPPPTWGRPPESFPPKDFPVQDSPQSWPAKPSPAPTPGPGGYPDSAQAPGGPANQGHPPQGYPPGGYPPGPGGYPPQGYPGPGPAYAPTPTQQPPGAPVRHRRPRVWPWILGFLLLLAALVGGCAAWVVNLAKAPIEATNSFVASLDDGHLDQAYQSLCASTQVATMYKEFAADQSAASQITGYTFSSVAANSGQLTQVNGTVSINGTPRTVSYGLHQEDGVWKVCTYAPLK